MKKRKAIALSLNGWRPSGKVVMKTFYVADTDVVGDSKNDILTRFGPPDEKKIFRGREIWEYYKVRNNLYDSKRLSVRFEFEDNIVTSSTGS